jgi:hypothetical protein
MEFLDRPETTHPIKQQLGFYVTKGLYLAVANWLAIHQVIDGEK